MIMDPAMAREKGVAFYRACTVRDVYRGIELCGPDGEELDWYFEPEQLAVPGRMRAGCRYTWRWRRGMRKAWCADCATHGLRQSG